MLNITRFAELVLHDHGWLDDGRYRLYYEQPRLLLEHVQAAQAAAPGASRVPPAPLVADTRAFFVDGVDLGN
jgi:hypothetical protein